MVRWVKDNKALVCKRAIDESEFDAIIELMAKVKEWADDLELFAIERMSVIKIIVYEQIVTGNTGTNVTFRKGF